MMEDADYSSEAYFPVSGLQQQRSKALPYTGTRNTNTRKSLIPVSDNAAFIDSLSDLIDLSQSSRDTQAQTERDTDSIHILDNRHAQQQRRKKTRDLTYIDHHVALYAQQLDELQKRLDDQRFHRSSHGSAMLLHNAENMQQQIQQVEAQWSTWILLHHIIGSSTASHASSSAPLHIQFSDLNKVLRIIQESSVLTRVLTVINWLEETAERHVSYTSQGSVDWKRTLRKAQLQRPSAIGQHNTVLDVDAEYRVPRAVWDSLDKQDEQLLLQSVWQLIRAGRMPDAIQLCCTFKQQWRAASMSGGELWHHSTMDHQATTQNRTGALAATTGNKQHFLWKHTCRCLSLASQSSPIEQAIYGLLGSFLTPVLHVCHSWEDRLWAMSRVLLDRRIDEEFVRFIKDENEKKYAATATASSPLMQAHNKCQSLSQIFQDLAEEQQEQTQQSAGQRVGRSLTATITTAARKHPSVTAMFHHLQQLLIMDEYDAGEKYLGTFIQQHQQVQPHTAPLDTHTHGLLSPLHHAAAIPLDESLLLFAVHLYLFLHPDTTHSEPLNQHGQIMVLAYLHHLIQTRHFSLIPLYMQYLPASLQITEYATFLQSLTQLDERKHNLLLAKHYCAETVLEIVKLLVSRIIEQTEDETKQRRPAATAPPTPASTRTTTLPSSSTAAALVTDPIAAAVTTKPISGLDQQKILALDCYDLLSTHDTDVMMAALHQINALYRLFNLEDKLSAAKQLYQVVSHKRFEQFLAMQTAAAADAKQSMVERQFSSVEMRMIEWEYHAWSLYMKSMNWYAAWNSQQALQPKGPTTPRPLPGTSAHQQRADKVRYDRELAKYEQDVAQWSASHTQITQSTIQSLLACLQQDGQGWLGQQPWMQQEQHTYTTISTTLLPFRRRVIPELLFLLHHVSSVSGHEWCLDMVSLVVDEKYRLYEVLDIQERRALMRKMKESYVNIYVSKEQQRQVEEQQQQLPGETEHAQEQEEQQEEEEAEQPVHVDGEVEMAEEKAAALTAQQQEEKYEEQEEELSKEAAQPPAPDETGALASIQQQEEQEEAAGPSSSARETSIPLSQSSQGVETTAVPDQEEESHTDAAMEAAVEIGPSPSPARTARASPSLVQDIPPRLIAASPPVSDSSAAAAPETSEAEHMAEESDAESAASSAVSSAALPRTPAVDRRRTRSRRVSSRPVPARTMVLRSRK